MEAAFKNCRPDTWSKFEQYVKDEIGGLSELQLLEAEDVKTAVREFFDEHLKEEKVSTLKKGKCVSSVLQFCQESGVPEAAPVESGIRNRKKKAEPVLKKQTDDGKGPKTASPTPRDPMEELTFKGQVIFLVVKAVLTLIIFMILQKLFTTYILRPAFDEEGPDIDAIIRKIQAEGPVTHHINRP